MLLSCLNRLYPSSLQARTLYRVMCGFDENYDMSLMQKDVFYLKQKGLVEYVDEAIGGYDRFEDRYSRLTAGGKEIADSVQTDPALEI